MNDTFRSSQEMIRLQSQDAKKLANQENRLKRLVDMKHQVQSLLVKRDHLRNEDYRLFSTNVMGSIGGYYDKHIKQ